MREHAFSGPGDSQRPTSGEVLRVNEGTLSLRLGATVLKNVPVAPPLDSGSVTAGDHVALLWHGEHPFAYAILNREAAAREEISSNITTAITRIVSVSGVGGGMSAHSMTGSYHTASGLTAGHVVRASGPDSFVWAQLQFSDLGGDIGDVLEMAAPAFTFATAAAEGVANTLVRSDAQIALFDATVPSTISPDDSAATGSAGYAARRDHRHAITCAIAVTLDANSTNAEGDASSFSRSNHVHTITTTADGQTDTDTILQSSAAGWLRLTALGINVAPTTTELRMDADLNFVGAQKITTTANDLTIQPANDLLLSPQGTSVVVSSLRDLVVNTNLLWVDASEDKVYINAGSPPTPPTYRGALTVRPGDAAAKGVVIQGLSGQNNYLFQILDHADNDLILVTLAGDLESGNPNFVSGLTGWQIAHDGTAEFSNVWVRGGLHASLFVADEMHATGGTLAVLTASRLASDVTLPTVGSSVVLNIDGSLETGFSFFAANDIIRMKAITSLEPGIDIYNTYFTVTSVGSKVGSDPGYYPTTCVLRWSFPSATSGKVIPGGTSLVKWGEIGGAAGTYTGGMLLTSDLNYAPYMDVFTLPADISSWASEPTPTPRVRVGNLDGVLGLGEEWGIAASADLSDNTEPHVILSDSQLTLKGVHQYWWDNAGNLRGEVNPDAGATDKLMWVGESSADGAAKLIVYGDGDVWLSSLAISEDAGAFLFSQADGLALWGPYGALTATSWHSSRGQAATISGAFHQEQGRWLGARGLVIEGGTINYVLDSSFEHATLGDYWNNNSLVTFERVSTYKVRGDYSLHVVTDALGDSAYSDTIASADGGETWTASCYVYVVTGGFKLTVQENDAGWTDVGNVTTTDLGKWQRVSVTVTLTAGVTDARILLQATSVAASEFYVDCVQFEEKAYATTYADGSMGTGYEFSGADHESASIRTVTAAVINDHVGLISLNNTWSCRAVAQMPYDSDGTWSTSTAFLWDARAWNDNVRVGVIYAQSNDTFRLYINGAYRCSSSAQSFSAGDWMDIVVTLDFSDDDYNLYVNGVLEDNDTTSLSAPTLTAWRLGSSYSSGSQGGYTIAEYAVFDRVLTADEVAALYAFERPLVDAGAVDKPGIYILDGQFSMATSTSGARTLMDNTGWWAYDADGNAAYGLSLKDSTSWGGFTLDKGDLAIGRSAAQYVQWDNSAGTLDIKGKITITASSSGIANLTDAGDLATADDLDDVDDGTTYSRVLTTSISAGKILLSEVTGDLDDVDDGTTYSRVLTTSISAGKILLSEVTGDLDDVDDGSSYGKLLLTDISAGHIQLTSNTVVSGEWYDESGVEIDAAHGINIYGTNNAFTTRATKTGTIQCSVNSSGQITAGAGNVVLDASGIAIATGHSTYNKVTWESSGSETIGSIWATNTSTAGYMDVWSYAPSAGTIARLSLSAVVGAVATGIEIAQGATPEISIVINNVEEVEIQSSRTMFYQDVYSTGDTRIGGGIYVGGTGTDPDANTIEFAERTSEPGKPAEGNAVLWMTNGAGIGDDGDVILGVTAGGSTKYTIIHDHSAATTWS
jgi:hypothetical protein